MLDKIKGIEDRYDEINSELEIVGDDYKRATELSKERANLEEIVVLAKSYRKATNDLEEMRALAGGDDDEMAALAKIEIEEL